jgi:hypothetical protein
VESVGTCEEECFRLGGRGVGSPTASCLGGSSVGGSAGGVVRETFRSYFIVAVGGWVVKWLGWLSGWLAVCAGVLGCCVCVLKIWLSKSV